MAAISKEFVTVFDAAEKVFIRPRHALTPADCFYEEYTKEHAIKMIKEHTGQISSYRLDRVAPATDYQLLVILE